MIRSVNQVVTEAELKKNIKQYVRMAPGGQGPIGVRAGKQIVGVYLSADEFDSLYAAAIRGLLRSRATGPTVTQSEARKRIQRRLQKLAKKS